MCVRCFLQCASLAMPFFPPYPRQQSYWRDLWKRCSKMDCSLSDTTSAFWSGRLHSFWWIWFVTANQASLHRNPFRPKIGADSYQRAPGNDPCLLKRTRSQRRRRAHIFVQCLAAAGRESRSSYNSGGSIAVARAVREDYQCQTAQGRYSPVNRREVLVRTEQL